MNLIKIKQLLSKSKIGIIIVKLYHKIIAIPLMNMRVLKYNCTRHEYSKIHIMEDSKTLELLINANKSFARFGDGEVSWIYRDSKGHFGQENSHELSSRLLEVIHSNDDNLLIGIPSYFTEMDEFNNEFKKARAAHLAQYENRWFDLLDDDRTYCDSLITRVYNGRKKNLDFNAKFNLWKKVWDKKNVLIVEGQKTRFGVGNDLLSNSLSIQRIIAPAENAFSKYNDILQAIEKIEFNGLVLLALGPTATVLAYDLAKNNIQAIDIGHLDIEYEWFKHHANKKMPIKGKYVNEAGGDSLIDFDEITLNNYNKEIICKIL